MQNDVSSQEMSFCYDIRTDSHNMNSNINKRITSNRLAARRRRNMLHVIDTIHWILSSRKCFWSRMFYGFKEIRYIHIVMMKDLTKHHVIYIYIYIHFEYLYLCMEVWRHAKNSNR